MKKCVVDKYGKTVKVDYRGVPVKSFHAIKCLIALAVVILIIVGIVVAAVFVVGDIAIKKLTNDKYSYNDVRVALNNISDYRNVEKNELNNQFTALDADSFRRMLADALFLNEIEQSDIDDIISAYAEKLVGELTKEKTETDPTTTLRAILDGGEDEGQDPKGEINEKLEQLLKKLFSASNIKKDKITGYVEENIDDYLTNVSDKSIAAFLNQTINSILDNDDLRDAINGMVSDAISRSLGGLGENSDGISLDGFDYKNILQIKQVTFYSNGAAATARAGVKIITQTNINEIMDFLFKDVKGKNFLRKEANGMAKFGFDSLAFIAKGLIKDLLPKKLYITVDIPVTENEKTMVSLNGTTQQDYENIMGIFAEMIKGEDGKPFKDPLETIFGEGSAINNTVKSINETIPIKETIVMHGNSGTVKLDFINLALELAGINTFTDEDGIKHRKPEEECVTNKDVYLLLKTVIGADTDAAMEEYPDYKSSTPKTDSQGGYVFDGGSFKYVPADPLREITEINDEYQAALLDAFKKSYGLGDSITSFDQLFEIISAGDKDEFLTLFEYEKINQVVNGTADSIKLDALMLSALVSAQTEKFLGQGGDFDLSSVTPRFITLYVVWHQSIAHNIMEVGLEINLTDLLKEMLPESDNLMGMILNDLMSALVPDSLLVRMQIDITAGGENFEYLPSHFTFDALEYEKADKLIKLLDGFGGDEGGFSGFLEEMLLPVRDMIAMMTDSLPGLEIGESALIMPDLYTLLASVLGDTLTPAEIEQVLKCVYFDASGNAWLNFNGGETADLQTLISQKIGGWEPLDITNLHNEASLSDSELSALINGQLPADYNGTITSVLLLAKDDESLAAQDLRQNLIYFGASSGDDAGYDNFDYMLITVKIDFEELGYDDSFAAFMPNDFYVTLLYKMDGSEAAFMWYRFNNMSEEIQNCLYQFLGFDNLEGILGAGEDNIGGGYFEDLANTVMRAIDLAAKTELGISPELASLVTIRYSYRASGSSGSLGELLITADLF